MNIELLIRYSLETLNERKNGETLFESLCSEVIRKEIDSKYLPATGLDSGGDGGIDGWSEYEEGKIKYAFSINKQWKRKLKEEIEKTNLTRYTFLRFFTNQPIPQRVKESKIYDNEKLRVEIYDLENLVKLINKNKELGSILDLPSIENAITIDYLQRYNQFNLTANEIATYIQRNVYEINSKTREIINYTLVEYSSNLPQFTILEARAGYGKTYSLQSLRQAILKRLSEINIPPVFVALRDYSVGNLMDMIETGMAASGAYQVKDALLLLDGFDEVSETDRSALLKEINQITIQSPYIRKVILSVRENTYDLSQFTNNDWQDVKFIYLQSLDNEDIQYLLDTRRITTSKRELFTRDPIFISFKDNIFYISKLLDFFEQKENPANSIIQLFEFLIENEVRKVFRKQENFTEIQNSLESLALYMTLSQKTKIRIEEIDKFLSLPNFPSTFEFSHKNLQEYLAAKKLSRQPIEIVKKLIARGNQILPFMTNTFGFLLNLFNTETNYSKFEEILDWSLLGEGNARKLLQIEPDKITKDINLKIFKSTVSQEAKSGSVWNIPSNLENFCLNGDARNENIQFLVEQLEFTINSDEFFYYSIVLQSLLYKHSNVLSEQQESKIKSVLWNLLDSKINNKNQEKVEYILSVVSKFKYWEFSNEDDYQKIKTKLFELRNSDTIFDNFCKILIHSNFEINIEQYLELLNYILRKKMSEIHQVARYSPTQIDDDFSLDYVKVSSWENFLILSEKMTEKIHDSLWVILRHLRNSYNEYFTKYINSDELEEYLKHLLKRLEFELDSFQIKEENKIFLMDWIFESANEIHINPVLKIVKKFQRTANVFQFLQEIINKAPHSNLNVWLFSELIQTMIRTENDYDLFQELFLIKNNERLFQLYKSVIYGFNTNHEIYSYIKLNAPPELIEEIALDQIKISESKKAHQSRQEKEKLDYKIAFNLNEIKKEISSIFEILKTEEIQRGKLWDYKKELEFENINQFVLFLLRYSTTDNEESIERNKLISILDSMDWDLSFMDFLIQYCSVKSIDINQFSQVEIDQVIDWVRLVVERFPLNNVTSPLKNVHRTLSYLLRKLNPEWIKSEIKREFGKKFLGLAFSGFPNQMHGAIIVNYDSFSIDYLGKVLPDRLDILKFIIENFEAGIKNSRVMIGITGYISKHIDSLFPGFQKVLKHKITQYLREHITEEYYPTILDCAYQLGFSPLDLEVEWISDALVVDEDQLELMHNFAASFYIYGSEHFSNIDGIYNHLSNALLVSFNKEKKILKKKIFAEYFLRIHRSGGDVFQWYVDYLLSNDSNPMSSRFVRYSERSKIYSNDINDLVLIEKLFIYAREKDPPNERRRTILDFVIASYKEMSYSINSDIDLDKILQSIDRMIQNGHTFMKQVKYEIESSYNERNYKPMELERIIELA
ncbi:hypothetical protein JWG41_12345 [Leptospira sp. 201903075]|uniref:NACHT domain-containing protein n=1 Tax=Leptospira chreensis TaxID=2810035 RepID=UPI0019644966|nr:hypothetical protein [Leptospira chreensis]MBM9591244.1 hypothetical protein [Leptospira chreensis]